MVTLLGRNKAALAQARHGAAHDYGVRVEHGRDGLRGRGTLVLGHVDQDVQHARKAQVLAHGGSFPGRASREIALRRYHATRYVS